MHWIQTKVLISGKRHMSNNKDMRKDLVTEIPSFTDSYENEASLCHAWPWWSEVNLLKSCTKPWLVKRYKSVYRSSQLKKSESGFHPMVDHSFSPATNWRIMVNRKSSLLHKLLLLSMVSIPLFFLTESPGGLWTAVHFPTNFPNSIQSII